MSGNEAEKTLNTDILIVTFHDLTKVFVEVLLFYTENFITKKLCFPEVRIQRRQNQTFWKRVSSFKP